ncbi:MAG: hypothetical protein ABJH45_13295 [Paracoccaceae bacterium]
MAGLIAHGTQVPTLCAKLSGRNDIMLVMGDAWLAAFSFQTHVNLPWLPDQPKYLYAVAPGLLCQHGYEPDIPTPLLPALVKKLAPQGTFAITQGPKLWDFSAATPVEECNLQAIV